MLHTHYLWGIRNEKELTRQNVAESLRQKIWMVTRLGHVSLYTMKYG